MTPKSDEYDVFRIPHSRMMQLVNSCNKNLNITDFANNDALFALLSNLHSVFNEFKSHEDIENEHIMKKLKSKLNAMAIYNSAVCNCHKDDEFTPLLNLVEMGYLFTNKTKTTSERISFGIKLRKALNKFTQIFVPHMKEEEEVFQPLLLKYFSQVELADMKNTVIKLHMQQRKHLNDHSNERPEKPIKIQDSNFNNHNCSISNSLPNEILLKVFSSLSLSDRFKVAKVSKNFNHLIYDRSNWKELIFDDWKHRPNLNETSHQDFGLKDVEYIDDDTDEEFDLASEIQSKDVRTLQFWIKHLLPRIGSYLVSLNLSNCKSLNNNLTRRILQMCPNLNKLDLSFTKVGDNSFRGVRLDKLNYLNFEGCEKLTDNAFKHLLLASIKPVSTYQNQINNYNKIICKLNECKLKLAHQHECACDNQNSNEISTEINIEDTLVSTKYDNVCNKKQEVGLSWINLSGCWSISDFGLSYIASKYELSDLRYLNLSGCLNLTSFGLSLFVETSDRLHGENFYYCDNITDGPMSSTANACENLECNTKYCCRRVH